MQGEALPAETTNLAGEQLVAFLYHEIRAIAQRHLSAERRGHTLSATALVNELYLRVAHSGRCYASEAEFLSAASRMIRNLLVDYARSCKRLKRGGERRRIALDELCFELSDHESVGIETLDEALTSLAEIGERQARVVELRFFGGLNGDQIAAELGVSSKTVKRDWAMARAWLRAWIGDRR